MNLFTQLENNEQRCKLASSCTVLGVMPGSQPIELGEEHIVGAIPYDTIVTGFLAVATKLSSDVVVSVGFLGNSTFFMDNVTLSNGVAVTHDKLDPMQDYFPNGEKIVMTIVSGGLDTDESKIRFALNYTELETNVGMYTA